MDNEGTALPCRYDVRPGKCGKSGVGGVPDEEAFGEPFATEVEVVSAAGEGFGGAGEPLTEAPGLERAGFGGGGFPGGEEVKDGFAGSDAVDVVFGEDGLKFEGVKAEVKVGEEDEGFLLPAGFNTAQEVGGPDGAGGVGGAFDHEAAGLGVAGELFPGREDFGFVVLAEDVEGADGAHGFGWFEGDVKTAEAEEGLLVGEGQGGGDTFGFDFDAQDFERGVEAPEALGGFEGGVGFGAIAQIDKEGGGGAFQQGGVV